MGVKTVKARWEKASNCSILMDTSFVTNYVVNIFMNQLFPTTQEL